MNTIFVIDTKTNEHIATIDFVPRREDRIIVNTQWKNLECKVGCVLYHPKEHTTLVFVDVVENYYEAKIKDIKWNV